MSSESMTQSLNEEVHGTELLTRKDIAERLGVTDAKLRPFTEVAPDFFDGKEGKYKGLRYPESAIEKFRFAIRMTPGTFREEVARAKNGQESTVNAAPAVRTPSVNDAVTHLLIESFTPAAEKLAAALQSNAEATRALPPPSDRLIGSADAADILHCKPRSVSRYVKPVRSGVYRESDIFRYIAGLKQKE